MESEENVGKYVEVRINIEYFLCRLELSVIIGRMQYWIHLTLAVRCNKGYSCKSLKVTGGCASFKYHVLVNRVARPSPKMKWMKFCTSRTTKRQISTDSFTIFIETSRDFPCRHFSSILNSCLHSVLYTQPSRFFQTLPAKRLKGLVSFRFPCRPRFKSFETDPRSVFSQIFLNKIFTGHFRSTFILHWSCLLCFIYF